MSQSDTPLVLAFYPSTRGVSFVLFQDPSIPLDWGIKEIRGKEKNARTLAVARKLLDRYSPDVLVLEATATKASRRRPRVRVLYGAIVRAAKAKHVEVHRYTKAEVHEHFARHAVRTKHDIAKVIAKEIPAYALRLPPVRKIWMNEDPRQSLFDAAALGLTHYSLTTSKHESPRV